MYDILPLLSISGSVSTGSMPQRHILVRSRPDAMFTTGYSDHRASSSIAFAGLRLACERLCRAVTDGDDGDRSDRDRPATIRRRTRGGSTDPARAQASIDFTETERPRRSHILLVAEPVGSLNRKRTSGSKWREYRQRAPAGRVLDLITTQQGFKREPGFTVSRSGAGARPGAGTRGTN